jgi:hypothetical protein
MSELFERLVDFAIIASGLFFWVCAAVNMILMAKHRKEGVPLFPHGIFWSPFNILFTPHLLNEKGLKARRRLICSVIGFVFVVGFVIAGSMIGILH